MRSQPALRLEAAYFGRDRPCTMLIDEVEAIWAPIAQADDWSRLEAKLGADRADAGSLRYGSANRLKIDP